MSEQQITLRQIAERANVSVAAVSYALHGKGRMSAETRSQLERMLKEANYKPSYKLRPVLYIGTHNALRDGHSLMPLLNKYEGLNTSFHTEDIPLRLELLHLPGAPSLDQQLDQFLSYRPSGILLDSDLASDLDTIARFFTEHDVPTVQIGHVSRSQVAGSVVVDSFGGAYTATQHFIALGHERIGTIRWNTSHDPASRQKFAGFTCAMAEAGLDVPEVYVVEAPTGRRGMDQPGRVAIEKILGLPEPPTAVFVENSFVSPSLLYPMPVEERVPDRIANLDMIHFEAWSLDWIEQVVVSKFSMPPCEGKLLRINWFQMGQVAGERMLAMLAGERDGMQNTRLAPQLVSIRGTKTQPLAY